MRATLDFNTLLVVLTLARVIQSVGLLFVWRLHRNYPPACAWSAGSALTAVGTLIIAFRSELPFEFAVIGGIFLILAGSMIFYLGVVRVISGIVPTRLAIATIATATIALVWFTLIEPSLVGRVGVFAISMMLMEIYTAVRLLRAPYGPLSGMQRFIAIGLLVNIIAFPMELIASSGLASAALTRSFETGFAFITISTTVLITLALAFLTNMIELNERRRLEHALLKTSRFLELILNTASDVAIIAAETDLKITVFNRGAEQLLGYRADEVVGKHTPAIFADPEQAMARSVELSAEFGRPIKGLGIIVDKAVIGRTRQWTYIRKDRSRVQVSMRVSVVRDEFGKPIGFLGVARDITEQLAQEQALKAEIARSDAVGHVLDTALSNMTQGLAMFDSEQRLMICNDNYMTPYGIAKANTWPGMPFAEIVRMRIANGFFSVNGPDNYLADRLLADPAALQEDQQHLTLLNDGRYIKLISHALDDGGCVVTSEDVTELKLSQARITFLAEHDALTGLANRTQFNAAIEHAAFRLSTDGTPYSVLMLDLDRFKCINDQLGHAAGDELLKELAVRIRRSVRDTDVVARLGGDEFAILQSMHRDQTEADIDPSRDATELARRILDILNEPIDLGSKTVSAGISIGIASAPADGTSPDELLKCADFALYESKSAGRNSYRVFDFSMSAATREREELESDMRAGLDRDEFALCYQPIVEARTREVAAVEAKICWNHPVRGLLPSGDFMAVAEQSGLIAPLGERLIRRACDDAVNWPDNVSLALNLSMVQLRKSDLLEVVRSALVGSGLSPHRLEVEVMESVLHEDNGRFIATLQQLRAMGVSVSLDHFGSGFSSLAYLTQCHFDKIKIDGTFTKAVVGGVEGMLIVSSVCSLARGLSMVSIADEVETEDQMVVLRAAGISFAQGRLFGRPCAIEDLDLGQYAAVTATGQR